MFIKVNNKGVLDVFRKMWDTAWDPKKNKKREAQKWDAAGQSSISKHELIEYYIKTKEQQ